MTKDSTQTTNSTPESQFWALNKHPKQVTSADITAVFDKLQPIAPEKLIGSRWRGYAFHSGHPAEKLLMEDLKFAGKDFVSLSEVNLMVFDGEGNWVKSEEWGNSRLREVKFREVVSAALISDTKPCIDYWRGVSDDVVMVALEDDGSLTQGAGPLYGYMIRVVLE
ncbi:uncharacterized protein BO72DRAFT_487510 [Aspergillus fijiensis CBS 313.89]|uniref:GXWXG domain-containing protein n=1 Tax=Aspergillus fijiensis CBS 313.89 TaxID=1448319 RepID=A0A8G1VXP1_9EURO|nr:uncharacterized protein BO72DRAFT_487510 [Aspergillus fijiensis CBS 313.89]RAK75466.1 hypothetical protein BO72DRAFT_487510 [Aspergillus fijiensis CBS 313.89]